MQAVPRVPEDPALDKPSQARMYDYLLGGYHNFALDRKAADQLVAINPNAPLVMQSYRAFLRRAVRYLIEQGIDQFIDIGSVTPTVGSVHEVAQQLNPRARVVYGDIDPDTVRHSETILQGNPNASAIRVDVRQPEQILSNPKVTGLLDFTRPTGVLISNLHFIPDDEQAYKLVFTLRDAVASGSYIAISTASHEGSPREVVEGVEALYAKSTTPVKLRSRTQIEAFFDGLELVPPGLVFLPLWRPEGPHDLFFDEPWKAASFSGVGRKP